MATRDHIAHVPYAELERRFREWEAWTCVVCGGRVDFLAFGNEPQPRRPLFECAKCGRRSDGCQTFEGHHLLYQACPLEDGVPSRCGHWRSEWAQSRGCCPLCGAGREVGVGGDKVTAQSR
ncbi:unnamed protein product [marine sediment metagenome]|uniref:Uncharacterized protein n=1 Tax=marine sediment metagenome TaxID=412755 RepID=X0RH15_9ZZZZ